MREIKLRAWHTPLQKMLFPEKIHLDNWLCTAFDYLQDDWVYQIKTENNMWLDLMQFTWLLDKNGKEIYEGDIYHQWDTRILYVVEWMDTWLKGRQIWNRSYAWISYFQPAIEIIWNIYENPDLLTNN